MTADDLAKILDELGQRLGPTGEHVFQLAVQYQLSSAVISLIGCSLLLAIIAVVTTTCARLTRRRWAEQVRLYAEGKGKWSDIRSGPDLEDYAMPWIFGGFIGAMAVGLLISGAVSSLITIANPEYSALRDIIGAIKP